MTDNPTATTYEHEDTMRPGEPRARLRSKAKMCIAAKFCELAEGEKLVFNTLWQDCYAASKAC